MLVANRSCTVRSSAGAADESGNCRSRRELLRAAPFSLLAQQRAQVQQKLALALAAAGAMGLVLEV